MTELSLADKTPQQVMDSNFVLQMSGKIKADSICDLNSRLLAMHLIDPKHRVTLFINSNGGETAALYEFVTLVDQLRVPLKTVVLGSALSSGFLMFLAGEERVVGPYSSLLAHRFTWGGWEAHEDLVAMRKEVDWSHEKMLRYIRSRTGLTRKMIEKELLPMQDVWLTPDDAIRLGVATQKLRIREKVL